MAVPDGLAQILIQLPIVAVFVWYTLEREKRDEAARLKRDGEWREFLSEQRRVSVAALTDVSRGLGGVADGLRALQMASVQHDVMTREWFQQRDVERGAG